MIELAKRIKWGGDANRGKVQHFSLGQLTIISYYHRKTRGVDEYNFIIVIKMNGKLLTDFSFTYKFKKFGNKACAIMLLENRYRIIWRIFK